MPRLSLSVFLALGLLAAACGNGAPSGEAEEAKRPLGLFTSLPLVWGESEDIGGLLAADNTPDPARTALEEDYVLVPLDLLSAEALAPLREVLMAQPRVLSPAENVALDDWVRAGGRVVIFADPLLTRHSRYSIGDKRRAQDVVLIAPILARWGLALAEESPLSGEKAAVLGETVAVREAGQLSLVPHEAPADCVIRDGGLVARCTIGSGRATVVADAALFDDLDEDAARAESLRRVIKAGLAD